MLQVGGQLRFSQSFSYTIRALQELPDGTYRIWTKESLSPITYIPPPPVEEQLASVRDVSDFNLEPDPNAKVVDVHIYKDDRT